MKSSGMARRRIDFVGIDVFGERFVDGLIETSEQLGQVFASAADQHGQAIMSFGGVIVDLDVSIFYITQQSIPARQRVANRRGGLRLPRELREDLFEPLSQRIEQRLGLLLADLAALFRRTAANLFFDAIQRTDPLQRFPRYRRSVRLLQIVKLAPHMRPARGLMNEAIYVELIESRVGIGLQRAAKLAKMPLRMFPFAIRRVGKPHCGGGGVARGTVIANISP